MRRRLLGVLDKARLERLWELLGTTKLAPHLVLVGSAAMYLAPTSVPPLTADADFMVDQAVLAASLPGFLAELERLGFQRVEDTATFVHPEGLMFDLLGLDAPGGGDRVVSLGPLSLLVFEELCQLSAHPKAIRQERGLRVLSPAALVLSKLRTLRLEKGVKDKVQALAMIGELSEDDAFLATLRDLGSGLPPEVWEDMVADAQAAFVGLATEEARGYARFAHLVERGFRTLQRLAPDP